jgi:NAD(P)-dependent dehydrogenase (short-subunit alcohol dehydrogenase family)
LQTPISPTISLPTWPKNLEELITQSTVPVFWAIIKEVPTLRQKSLIVSTMSTTGDAGCRREQHYTRCFNNLHWTVMIQLDHHSEVQLSILPVNWELLAEQAPVSHHSHTLAEEAPKSDESAAYCASKAAVIGMTRADAMDYSAENIRVNCICPGLVDTPMTTCDEERLRLMQPAINTAPMKRMAQVDEIADCALFLSSTRASFVQGHAMVVDGGYIIN